jgi:hypothetical protein
MSKDELKDEIGHELDRFSDSTLHELLHFLKQLEEKPFINQERLKKILQDDRGLLKRLAQ